LLQRNHTTIKFRDDITLWEDDLHDNGTAWLKVRTFVCKEGWACLLRNYIRVDNVLVRVIDTRYIHIFGSPNVYREYSYKEGTWKDL
ncbi:TIP41-like protein, partial [Fragilariopsis cylindrus CCMP1102]